MEWSIGCPQTISPGDAEETSDQVPRSMDAQARKHVRAMPSLCAIEALKSVSILGKTWQTMDLLSLFQQLLAQCPCAFPDFA